MLTKKKILLFSDWYEPGYKAGGPIRSCVNFVQHMSADYAIYIFTSDRDLDADKAYESIITDQWQKQDSDINIYYCSPVQLNWKNMRKQLTSIKPDFIYLNSMFSKYFTLYPLLINRWVKPQCKVILAPRGMLRISALQFKSAKKKIFLNLFRLTGFQKKIFFQAADETEKKDIQHCFGHHVHVEYIPNFPGKLHDISFRIEKKPGELFILFVGRIHPIKNLDYLLQILIPVNAAIRLTIVGSIEDKFFWQKCEQLISQLSETVSVHFMGELPNNLLPGILKEQHIFSLPTKGENFGHAIFEALSSGKPVLISDQTPWRNLEQEKAGWDIPLQKHEKFTEAIIHALAWDQDEYNVWSHNAFNFAKKSIDTGELKKKYRQLFS